jgi:hypothetical protein
VEIQLSIQADNDLPAVFEHQPVEFVCPQVPGAELVLAVDGRVIEPFLRPGETAWRWRWNPGAAVGAHELRLEARGRGGAQEARWRLRVVPGKIDQERYALLLEDVEHLAAGLAFTLSGSASEGASPSASAERRPSPPEEYYALFAERLDTLEIAVRRIYARPREQLRRVRGEEPLGGPTTPDAAALAHAARGQLQPAAPGVAPELQQAISPAGGLLPGALPVERGAPSADFYEHRLLKRLLALLTARARRIGAFAERLAARLERAETPGTRLGRAREIAAGCEEAVRRLRELRAAPLLAEVGPLPAFRGPTPLLQRDPAYREVYRAWLALHRAPLVTLTSPLFELPIADLPQLYETWCALQVASALAGLGETREQHLVRSVAPADAPPDDLDLSLALAEDGPLLRVLRGETLLTLRYQPRYRPQTTGRWPPHAEGVPTADESPGRPRTTDGGPSAAAASSTVPGRASFVSLDRHTRVPDLAIEIERPGEPPRLLLLDAKYRLEGGGGVPQDALADAYAYLGAIGSGGSRATCGAVLLFPGRGAPERYPSGVGAIPLLPGAAGHLTAEIIAWIENAAA